MQQLILGTGTAIWWLTEPHWQGQPENKLDCFDPSLYLQPSLIFATMAR